MDLRTLGCLIDDEGLQYLVRTYPDNEEELLKWNEESDFEGMGVKLFGGHHTLRATSESPFREIVDQQGGLPMVLLPACVLHWEDTAVCHSPNTHARAHTHTHPHEHIYTICNPKNMHYAHTHILILPLPGVYRFPWAGR